MFLFMPAICFSKAKSDSTILEKVWSYRRNYVHYIGGKSMNTYMRYTLNTERRNFTMFLVPTLYAFAKGDRLYISEIYGRTDIEDSHTFTTKPQIISNTIPHDRQVSEVFMDYLTPNIYDMTIYEEKLLSPFYRNNRIYYRYKIENDSGNLVHVSFRPKLSNTQLVKGYALVDRLTGRVVYTTYDGEFDMLKFHVDVTYSDDGSSSVIPLRCKSDMNFKFIGNKVTSHFLATYDAPTTLPDSLNEVNDRQRMDTLRTVQLRADEKEIYKKYDLEKEQEREEAQRKKEKEEADTLHKKRRSLGDVLWDIGDKLVTSSHADALGADFSLSPIINPQYVSYSHSNGFSYKIQLGLRYKWNKKRYLTIKPEIGYNFKIKQFYHYTPIRMNYNPKRNGYAEIVFANGNRIYNNSILEALKDIYPEIDVDHEFEKYHLDYFTDNYIRVINNVVAFDWLEIKSGIVYHIRKPENVSGMDELDLPTRYRSFAPTLTFHVTPWRKGPYFTLNYEQSFKNILGSNLAYGRFEFDVSHKLKLDRLRLINLKGGFGFYTNTETSYFLDYTNFRDHNLPGGWEDDWTGNFQLLNSTWYNTSRYYYRVNTSYESPLLVCSFLPFIGKFIENERIYFSFLSIKHTRPYFEVGYGVKTQFLSIGAFASFLNTKYNRFGIKLTFELFRKW